MSPSPPQSTDDRKVRRVGPPMVDAGWGRVVVVASMAGLNVDGGAVQG